MRTTNELYEDSQYTSESKMRVNNRNWEFANAVNAIESRFPDVPFEIIYDVHEDCGYHVVTVSFKSENSQVFELLEEARRRYWVRSFLEKRK